jgi:hypothetical protein
MEVRWFTCPSEGGPLFEGRRVLSRRAVLLKGNSFSARQALAGKSFLHSALTCLFLSKGLLR